MANKFPLILNTSANQIQEIASGDNLDLTGCKIVGLQGINSAGIVTFTKAHVGAATTWGEDLVVTGNARVTGILTVGTNSVVINGNDVNITGVTTASNFKTGTSNLHNVGIELAGINVLGADTPIGTGATIYNSGAAVFTGIVTAANYVGTINTPAQPNITSLGTLSALNVSGNVSIGGTLTYEDVTNIDSVGLITARNGINVSGGTATFAGNATFNGNSNVVAGNYLDIQDGKKLRLGTDGDLSFYHQGGANFIKNSSSQIIHIQTDASIRFNSTTGSHNILIGEANGPVKLFYNNSNKIETTNTGAVVTGILTATGNVDIAHGSGQAHYQITQTSGNTVKFGLVSGSDVEISGSSNNNIVIKRAGATRLTATSSGVNFGGTDYGFGATPGGTPASKNVFLAIGDSDTGIVQDGDGQLELWANAVEVANINAIDGYTSTKPITTTNNISGNGATFTNDLTAKSALFTDNGTASPIVDIRADDGGPWQLQIANDQYATGAYGLNLHLDNSGNGYLRLQTGATSNYKSLFFGLNNGTTTLECLTLTSSSTTSLNRITAPSLTLNDNGTSGTILEVRTDDNSPWAFNIGNDSYHASKGLNFYQDNNGDMYQKLFGNSAYVNYFIQQSDSSTTQNVIKIDQNRAVTLYYQGSSRLYTADPSSTGVGMYIENGSLEVKHTNDWQLRLWGSDGWAGIQFKDNSNSDQIWYNGSNSTFTIGGGGSNVSGKKLHIDGAVTIGDAIDNLTVETNGLKIQGPIDVGVNSVADSISRFTNEDSGSAHFTHLAGRVLHSNGSGWDGNNSTDGVEPMIVCSVSDRAGNAEIGDSCGIMMHSESDDDYDYSPIIGFSARAASTSYNSIYAAIVGKKTGTAADTNWNAGQLNFYTAGKESVRAPDQYMDATPDFFIDRRGFTGTPRHPRFRAYKSGSNWSVNANTDMIWDNTVYNIGGYYNTSNGRFTAPKDGFYYFNFYSITYGSYTNGCVYVTVNGNRQSGGDVHYTTGGQWENVGWQGVYKLTAGQYVAVRTCGTVTYHGGTWSTFEGYLVSSEAW